MEHGGKGGASTHRRFIPKPFILWLLAVKLTCTIRQRRVHARHALLFYAVLSVQEDLEGANA